MNNQQTLVKALQNKDVGFIAKELYGFDLSKGQKYIVKRIAFMEKNRLSISCHTRYGKTFCVTLAIAMLIDMGIKVRVAFIGPKSEQAGLLRQYMSDLILKNPSLLKKAQLSVKGSEKIQKEASRKRMTFTTGAEYRVFTAEGEADRIMGFGVDVKGGVGIIVKDEACYITDKANAKIGRMMGSNPDKCIMIELYNPWDRATTAFQHTLDPNFEYIHIGWEQGVKEGRTTKAFVEEQRRELTPIEFEVLWDSNFPAESEDSIFNLIRINEAEERKFLFEEELQNIEKRLKETLPDPVRKELMKEFMRYKRIISCDPADMGLDETVIYWGTQKDNKYELIGEYHEPKSDQMNIVGRIMELTQTFIKNVPGRIKIDRIGIGTGALSRLNELVQEKDLKNIQVIGCHFGESAFRKDFFINKKAENYFVLRDIFNEGFLSIPEIRKLKNQLVSMKWELSSASKKKVIDPEKSPDYCFIGDTKISTIKGQIPIKDIREGDKVITPFGIKKVKQIGVRSVDTLLRAELSNGKVIYTTPNHKAYTNERFKYFKDLNINDNLETDNIINLIKWRLKKLFNIMEENIGFRQRVDTIMQTSIQEMEKKEDIRKHYIDKYGKITIIGKFLKDMLYTILMEIPLIILLKTYNLLKIANIKKIIWMRNLKIMIIGEEIKKDWTKSEIKQKNGMPQKQEINGIENIIPYHLLTQRNIKKYVSNVMKNMKQPEYINQCSVQGNVPLNIIETQKGIVKIENVLIAKKSTGFLTNMLKVKPVLLNVLHYLEKKINVYNITVEDDGVYYADNILVSNCDSLVYFTWKEEKATFEVGSL